MRTLVTLAVLTAALFAFDTSASAQGYQVGNYTPGVDMPLFAVREYFGRDTFAAQSLTATYSLVILENTDTGWINPSDAPRVDAMTLVANGMSPPAVQYPATNGNGPIEFPHRIRYRGPKETATYNGIDWRNVQPATSYTQFVEVSWEAGVGQYTGQYYPAGSTIVAFDYTVQ